MRSCYVGSLLTLQDALTLKIWPPLSDTGAVSVVVNVFVPAALWLEDKSTKFCVPLPVPPCATGSGAARCVFVT